jgi:hypothetical protein
MMADDDPVRLELDEIRDRAALAYASPARMAESGADVPRLVEAITALLEDHKPMPLYAAGPRDKPCDCGHDFDAGCHDEAGNGDSLCLCQPEGFACEWCRENLIDPTDAEEWPCNTYTIAAKALLGGGAGNA